MALNCKLFHTSPWFLCFPFFLCGKIFSSFPHRWNNFSFLFSGSQVLTSVLPATRLTSVSVVMKLRVACLKDARQLHGCSSEKNNSKPKWVWFCAKPQPLSLSPSLSP